MEFNDILQNPQILTGCKVGGQTITEWIGRRKHVLFYEGKEDAGNKSIVYLYRDAAELHIDKPRVYGFRTTFEGNILIGVHTVGIFATIGEYRVIMPESVRRYLTDSATRPQKIDDYEVKSVLGFGCKGVTYKVMRPDIRAHYALKLTISAEYQDHSSRLEINRMQDVAARDPDHFPQVHGVNDWKFEIAGQENSFVYFVEEYLEGDTLEKVLEEKPDFFTPAILEGFVREMLLALQAMQEPDWDLMHDDLHAGNIVLRALYQKDPRPYIIDFGSAKPRGTTRKQRDDIRNLASHVARIVNIIRDRETPRTKHEEAVLTACEGLLAVMSDDDPLRRKDSAGELLHIFQECFPKGEYKQHLERPFDFGNAEEVLDNRLLQKLSIRSFPWREEIESSGNLLLIGPRGCGKTTVFRSMSFNCLADSGRIEDALSLSYLGLYISCNRDFRLRFSALEPSILVRREREIRHYFNLLVLREFTGALIACETGEKLGETDRKRFRDFLERFFGCEHCGNSSSQLRDIEGCVTRAIGTTRMSISQDRPLAELTDQSFLADLALFAGQQIGPFLGKVLHLFVDDYTERKVPKEAQRALNHILFVPNGIYKSKISSEVFGVPHDQTFGSFLDQSRDYKEMNLGTRYCYLPPAEQMEFLKNIIDNRLAICKYAGRVDDIIGPSHYSQSTFAKTLKCEMQERARLKAAKQGQGPDEVADQEIDAQLERENKKTYYHGWQTICELCTGDVSNVLELLERMYKERVVTSTSRECIRPVHQNSVIQKYSRQYLLKVKGIPQFGEQIFGIVDAFGTMSHQLLVKSPWLTRPEGRKDPYRLIRIEMDESYIREIGTSSQDDSPVAAKIRGLEETAMHLWRLLQRYCVFVDAEESRSRRNTLASKVILRRIFCPAFRIDFTNSESYTLDKGKWTAFCANPKDEASRYVRDRMSNSNVEANGQQDLFAPNSGEIRP